MFSLEFVFFTELTETDKWTYVEEEIYRVSCLVLVMLLWLLLLLLCFLLCKTYFYAYRVSVPNGGKLKYLSEIYTNSIFELYQ